MNYSKHGIYLEECGYRELGYFNGLLFFQSGAKRRALKNDIGR